LDDWPRALLNKKQHGKKRSACFVTPFNKEMYLAKSVNMMTVN